MKKYIHILLILFFGANISFAQDELTLPKNPAYRLGVTYDLEKEYKVTDLTQTQQEKTASYAKEYIKNSTYADSSLKDLSNEISKLLTVEKEDMLEHIQILWTGAALRSETIKFALYKLSNPDADKPDENIVKKIIRPLSTVSSIAGAGLGDPFSATAALVGGHLLNSLSFNDKDLNYKYTKVTDADMIVLITKVDNMQKKVIDLYYDYVTSYNLLSMCEKNIKSREEKYNSSIYETQEQLLIADAYYRAAIDTKAKLELEFLENRAALEQLVGIEALTEFENVFIKN
ncbi:MAG: hypothetical protein LUH11_03350 [Candidatus Gastranaerophilales bacterium]|nr:hypothetical protein [Candidatus Gastranaerophilales bacterium]